MVKLKKWIYPEEKVISSEIIKLCGSNIIAKLLIDRGIDTIDKVKNFLSPEKTELKSPYVFKDMKKAVERIKIAIDKQELILIYGDFDADGVTSTSLLLKMFKKLGANVDFYIPDRSKEGHGPNKKALIQLISKKQAKLIITVDCGISSIDEVKLVNSLGRDIIVTDHHDAPEVLPDAYAIINPKAYSKMETINESDCYLEYLAGVGVAYKLALAILEEYNQLDFKDELLPFVAIGSIADVVPLIEENRAIVKIGLELLSQNRPYNIVKLLEIAGFKSVENFSSDHIAFAIAPRINAIGRIDSASVAVEFLTTEDRDRIDYLAEKLNENNKIRQQLSEEIFQQADVKVQEEIDFKKTKGIVLTQKDWHPGIIGIVASKLSEKYYCPVFLISIDEENALLRCSARSVEGFHLFKNLQKCEDLLEHYGGHSQAAGFSALKENYEPLMQKLNELMNESLNEEILSPKLKVDANITMDDLTADFIEQIKQLEPFGSCNPVPVFSISNLKLNEYKQIGSNKNHLKLAFSLEDKSIGAVWWQNIDINANTTQNVNAAFFPSINEFNGNKSIQLEIKDIQNSDILLRESFTDLISSYPRWVDHRNKNDYAKYLTKYIKTTKNSYSIFAESQSIIEKLQKFPLFANKIQNRLTIQKTDELFLFEIPANKILFNELLEKSDTKILHFIPIFKWQMSSNLLIKQLYGMLKYAHSNKNGSASINEIAAKLSCGIDTTLSCLKLFNDANYINIKNLSSSSVDFELITQNLNSSISDLPQYDEFIKNLEFSINFRREILSQNIDEISVLLTK
ncbi:MAG: single-stranded-DNA-specific exonuclease RecJ [Candidatus Gastranaerophilales bacterium]|nr:single-stranded-DNA-specific exonuclease RecJ [Candidatus Gastranaerophilales bacterium]